MSQSSDPASGFEEGILVQFAHPDDRVANPREVEQLRWSVECICSGPPIVHRSSHEIESLRRGRGGQGADGRKRLVRESGNTESHRPTLLDTHIAIPPSLRRRFHRPGSVRYQHPGRRGRHQLRRIHAILPDVKQKFLLVVCLAFIAVSCGEAGPLDGVGDRTREFVEGETTTTLAIPSVSAGIEGEALVSAVDVLWFNDPKTPQYTGDPDQVIGDVWLGRTENSRFVQSSRAEIASALPALAFPSLVPAQVRWITSQLVYKEALGTLDPDTSTAFGLWSSDPYQSDTGRVAVLRVGRAPVDTPAQRSEILPLSVPDGISLSWTDNTMRYELYCRSEISEDLCLEVAESSEPLVLQLGSGTSG